MGLVLWKRSGLGSEYGLFFLWNPPISLKKIATNSCIYSVEGQALGWQREGRDGGDEREKTLLRGMEEAHGTDKFLVTPYTDFQIIFPVLYLTLILCPTKNPRCWFCKISWVICVDFHVRDCSSAMFDYHTYIFFLAWIPYLLGTLTFKKKKKVWIYTIFNFLTLILVGSINGEKINCVVNQKAQYCFPHFILSCY